MLLPQAEAHHVVMAPTYLNLLLYLHGPQPFHRPVFAADHRQQKRRDSRGLSNHWANARANHSEKGTHVLIVYLIMCLHAVSPHYTPSHHTPPHHTPPQVLVYCVPAYELACLCAWTEPIHCWLCVTGVVGACKTAAVCVTSLLVAEGFHVVCADWEAAGRWREEQAVRQQETPTAAVRIHAQNRLVCKAWAVLVPFHTQHSWPPFTHTITSTTSTIHC